MANIIGSGNIPQQKPKIDISQSTPMICEVCGEGKTFIPATKVRKLSKLAYGGDQDVMIPFEIYLCGDCGAEQELMKPLELRALESKDKMSSQPKLDLDING